MMASQPHPELSSNSLTEFLRRTSTDRKTVTDAAARAATNPAAFLKAAFHMSAAQEESLTKIPVEAWATTVWHLAFWLNHGYADATAHYLTDGKRCRVDIMLRRTEGQPKAARAVGGEGRVILYEGDGWRIGIEANDGGVDIFVEFDKS